MRTITDVLCDASIIVPLFVDETKSLDIMALINASGPPIVSDFALGEVSSALSIRVRRREIGSSEAADILLDLDGWVVRRAQRVATEADDVVRAMQFVRRFELALKMPDALHLAIAWRIGSPIATHDRRQAAAAAALGLRAFELGGR
jgi:uncharacterized protein